MVFMDSKSHYGFLGVALSAAVAFGVVALAVHRWKAWTALGITVACLGAAVCFLVVIYRDKPRLFIGKPSMWQILITPQVDSWGFSTSIYSSTKSPDEWGGAISARPPEIDHEKTHLAIYLDVWNEPKRKKSTRRAEEVHTSLRFLDGDTEIYNLVGRWSDLDQRDAPETYSVPRIKELAPNGRHFRIDIAGLIDGGCYALNDEARHRGYKVFPLPPSVLVEVTAHGVGNLRNVSKWLLENDGGMLTLSPLNP